MDEESLCNGNKTENEESFAPPEKRNRISNDDVFLAPLESISSNDNNEDKELPLIKKSTYDPDSMHMLLPKVPCLTPASIATSTPSISSLTAHLSRPPLNIPSLSFEPYQQKMELPNQTNISVSMPDISTLINKQNVLSSAVASSYSILKQAIDPKTTYSSSSNGMISNILSSPNNSIKLPINLSTLVPVSKQSLNMDEVDKSMSPLPITTANNASSVLTTSQNPFISQFSLNTLSALSPLLPTISPQIQNIVQTGTIIPEISSSANTTIFKESKPNNASNRRGRSIPNSVSSGASLSWPGVDAIVESYRKYNQGRN